MERVEFGVWLASSSGARRLRYKIKELDFEDIKGTTLKAEKLGYHSVWITDHLSFEGSKERLESWTVLSALSSITKKIRLGTIVLCNLYRHPGLVAQMASTLDIISKGRLEFGIGAGWNEIECNNYGITFPKPKPRLDMLEESVEIIKKLWTQEKTTYNGKYYTIKDAYCEPKPVQKPHPPIMIGGSGEKRTLKIVARHADRSNFGGSPEVVKRKMDILRKYSSTMGRDYGSIVKTTNPFIVIAPTRENYLEDMKERYVVSGSTEAFKEWLKKAELRYFAGTPEECVEKIKLYVDLGMRLFILRFGRTPEMDDMEIFAKEVIGKINDYARARGRITD